MIEELARGLTDATALGAAAVGGGLGVFSVMVIPALQRLPAGAAVAAMQRINEAALTPPFLGVFLGTAAGSAAVAAYSIVTLGDTGAGPRLAGAGIYLSAVLLTGVVNVPANDALALIDPGDAAAAQRAWSDLATRWVGANHVRSVAALAAAVLLAWR